MCSCVLVCARVHAHVWHILSHAYRCLFQFCVSVSSFAYLYKSIIVCVCVCMHLWMCVSPDVYFSFFSCVCACVWVLTHTPAGVYFSCWVHARACVYVLTHTPIGVNRNQKNLIGGNGIIGGCEPPPLDVGVRVLMWVLWKSSKGF